MPEPVILSLIEKDNPEQVKRIADALRDIAARQGAGLTIGMEINPVQIRDIDAYKAAKGGRLPGTFTEALRQRDPELKNYFFSPFWADVREEALRLGFNVQPIDSDALVKKAMEWHGRRQAAWAAGGGAEARFQLMKTMGLKRNRFIVSRVKRLQPQVIITGDAHAEAIRQKLGFSNIVRIGSEHYQKIYAAEAAKFRAEEANAREEWARRAREKRAIGWQARMAARKPK